jgi:hypothetical protein
MTWDELQADFAALWRTRRWGQELHRLRGAATRLFASASPAARQRVADLLADDQLKWFAAFVLDCAGTLSRRYLEPMLRAAVYERNPSNNRTFIEPCLRSYGTRAVVERLLEYVAAGTDFEKAGAVNALYWAWRPKDQRVAAPDGREELAARERELLLREFVANPNPDVRRSIIPQLSLDRGDYPPDLKRLVPQAIRIAETEGDEYVRHRLSIQLGGAAPFMALPDRKGEP